MITPDKPEFSYSGLNVKFKQTENKKIIDSMSFGLFKKRKKAGEKKPERPRGLEKAEIEVITELGGKEEAPPVAADPQEPTEIPKEVEETPITEIMTESMTGVTESTLKELNERIDRELVSIRQRLKDIGKTTELTLESPKMIDLLDLYTSAKDKLKEFINEINGLNLRSVTEKKTFAAIHKFRACRTLSEIRKEIKKIESISRKAGFIPTKVHDILGSKAEDLIDTFDREEKKEKNDSITQKSK